MGWDEEWWGESCSLSFEHELSASTGRPSTHNEFLMAPNLTLLRPPFWVWGVDFPTRKGTCRIFWHVPDSLKSLGEKPLSLFPRGGLIAQNPTVGWILGDFRLQTWPPLVHKMIAFIASFSWFFTLQHRSKFPRPVASTGVLFVLFITPLRLLWERKDLCYLQCPSSHLLVPLGTR